MMAKRGCPKSTQTAQMKRIFADDKLGMCISISNIKICVNLLNLRYLRAIKILRQTHSTWDFKIVEGKRKTKFCNNPFIEYHYSFIISEEKILIE